MKRKLVIGLMAGLLVWSVTGCGSKQETPLEIETEQTVPASPKEQFGTIENTEDPNAPKEDRSSLEGLEDQPVVVPENPGDQSHFSFSYNGKNYEFTANEETLLYRYKSFMEDTDAYEDQGGIIDLVNKVKNRPSRLMGTAKSEFEDVKDSSELVYEGENTAIYKYTDADRHWDYYYVVWDEFVFQIYDYQLLIAAGVTEKDIFDVADRVGDTLKEAESDISLSAADAVILAKPVFDEYRFAFPPVCKPSYTVTFNVDAGEVGFSPERVCVNGVVAMQGMEVYHVLFTFDTDADTSVGENLTDTGQTFADYTIYEDPDGMTGGISYQVMLGEEPVCMTMSSASDEFTPAEAVRMLELLFTKEG